MHASRRIVLALIAVALSSLEAAPAVAQLSVGYHYSEVTCYRAANGPYQMVIDPTIHAAPVATGGGYFPVGGNGGRTQWTAFRVHLFRSTDLVNWTWDSADSWLAGQVGEDNPNNPIPDTVDWWNYDRQRWETRARTFDVHTPGYYRAAIEYYWYADGQVPAGYLFEWANDHYDSTGDGFFLISRIACQV